jgi:hypothetical protein
MVFERFLNQFRGMVRREKQQSKQDVLENVVTAYEDRQEAGVAGADWYASQSQGEGKKILPKVVYKKLIGIRWSLLNLKYSYAGEKCGEKGFKFPGI